MSEKIDVKKAAKILGVSKKTVYSRLRSGKIQAEKVDTKHGKKWLIDKDKLTEQATIENEVVEVKEINQLIKKEQLMNELIEAVNSQNKQLIKESMENIDETIKKQNKILEQQSNKLESLEDRLQSIQDQQNNTLFDKIKNFFKKL
ncbi:MAG: helix-turn-helix domain-containing protein [Candidatus Woesearchaeota archaeon]